MQFQESSPPNFCSCLIHQAQLPNKLGNFIFKHPLKYPNALQNCCTVRFLRGKLGAWLILWPTLDTCSDVMPGFREAAASCFDTLP